MANRYDLLTDPAAILTGSLDVRIATRNQAAVGARFRRYGEEAEAITKRLVREHAERQVREVRQECENMGIHDSGYMIEATTYRLSADGLESQVGYWSEDFIGGLRFTADQRVRLITEFYPPYVVLGTERMPARDPLSGPFERSRRDFPLDLAAALARAASDVGRTE